MTGIRSIAHTQITDTIVNTKNIKSLKRQNKSHIQKKEKTILQDMFEFVCLFFDKLIKTMPPPLYY